jgi:hypothetical protein
MAFYLGWMLLVRLTGVVPGSFHPWCLGLVVAGAAVGALFLARRPDRLVAAHAIDSPVATDDLYLTVVQAGAQDWGYGEIVLSKAEAAAAGLALLSHRPGPHGVAAPSPGIRLARARIGRLSARGRCVAAELR